MKAVVGMNYGDEGKGHMVDYFTSPETLVVRHNGGAQAGHGVATSEGASHVFHHFGSGSLRGGRTLLARRFILNPIMFMHELDELLKITTLRETLIDPRCVVTTPYDMMINHYSAHIRASHDTVGIGINETVERSQYDDLCITARNLKERTRESLLAQLKQIENEWIQYRLAELKLPENGFKVWARDYVSLDLEEKFLDYSKWMIEKSVIWEDANVVDRYLAKAPGREVVFEGAQGMLLDQRRSVFAPYLTRSNTGMRNVNFILDDMNTKIDVEVVLVTRSYLTRHGDGPMFNSEPPYAGLGDSTNPENEYQGKMRFGSLDANWYVEAIEEIKQACPKMDISVAVTCMDHAAGEVIKFWNGDDLPVEAIDRVRYVSNGPTENDIIGPGSDH